MTWLAYYAASSGYKAKSYIKTVNKSFHNVEQIKHLVTVSMQQNQDHTLDIGSFELHSPTSRVLLFLNTGRF